MNETPTNSGTVLKSYNMVTEVKWGEAQNEAENNNWKKMVCYLLKIGENPKNLIKKKDMGMDTWPSS